MTWISPIDHLVKRIAYDQQSAWEARRKDWWLKHRTVKFASQWREIEYILERLWHWRDEVGGWRPL